MRLIPLILLVLSLAACGAGQDARGEREAPLVKAAIATPVRFVDRIEAVGTARANEQVTVSAPVTERITRLNFEDGGYVKAGQVIATLARGQESAQLEEAQAQARVAGQQLDRLQQLKSRGFATNSSVDAQIAAAATARAQAAAAEASIGDRVIRAPFSGYVSLRMISAGAVVQAGTEIATISDLSRIKLDFPVPETLLSAIETGQTIEARAAAYPDQPFRGTIATIDSVVDPATRSVLVRAELPNPDRLLKPGMLLRVGIESDPRTAVAVPELAVIGEGEQRYVFLIGADGVARRSPVKTGVRREGKVEIVEGLKPGQKVVGEGVVKVTEGIKVRVAGPGNAAARTSFSGSLQLRHAELDSASTRRLGVERGDVAALSTVRARWAGGSRIKSGMTGSGGGDRALSTVHARWAGGSRIKSGMTGSGGGDRALSTVRARWAGGSRIKSGITGSGGGDRALSTVQVRWAGGSRIKSGMTGFGTDVATLKVRAPGMGGLPMKFGITTA